MTTMFLPRNLVANALNAPSEFITNTSGTFFKSILEERLTTRSYTSGNCFSLIRIPLPRIDPSIMAFTYNSKAKIISKIAIPNKEAMAKMYNNELKIMLIIK